MSILANKDEYNIKQRTKTLWKTLKGNVKKLTLYRFAVQKKLQNS